MTSRKSKSPTRRELPPVVQLSPDDLDDVEALRAESNKTLGFVAKVVMDQYLGNGGGIGMKEMNELVSYVLFGVHSHHLRIMHLCVAPSERGRGLARRLVEAVVEKATKHHIGIIKLNCRRDYPANAAWPKLGFFPVDEKDAKTAGKRLVTWYRTTTKAPQQDLFSTLVSDDKVRAVIDAQILFQLQRGDDEVANGLQADFVADVLELHIAKETFNEINRAPAVQQRQRSRDFAHSFPSIDHDEDQMLAAMEQLKCILPSTAASEESDIRQLAMTAASNINIFVTRDKELLQKAAEIKCATSIELLHPQELIIRLAEYTDRGSYNPAPISGLNLVWRRIAETDLPVTIIGSLLGPHERKSGLQERFERVLSNPATWRTEGLWSADTLIAVRSVKHDRDHRILKVGLCRACRGGHQLLHTEYAFAGLAQEAVKLGCDGVELDRESITPEAVGQLGQFGFVQVDDIFVRDCPATTTSMSALKAKVKPRHDGASPHELARNCSPVALEDDDLPCLMVPIRPGYARSLFDTSLAADDLFGVENSVLLRWENVYYRGKTHHRMIKAPARILWYVSAGIRAMVAISYLNDVRIGSPKVMFREHRKLGTLGWREIQKLCRGDSVQNIMVLKFSHSFLFRSRINFHTLKCIYKKYSKNLVVQSPSTIPKDVFLEIYRRGFNAVAGP